MSAPRHGSAGLAAVLGAALLAAVVAPSTSRGAVLCVKAHKDGTLGGVLRLRDGSCAKREVEVDPASLGLCCGGQTTTPIPCGPTLTCDPKTEMCVSHGPVGPAVVYECLDVPAGCEVDRTCGCASGPLCVAPFDVCTDVGPDAIHCECPQCQ